MAQEVSLGPVCNPDGTPSDITLEIMGHQRTGCHCGTDHSLPLAADTDAPEMSAAAATATMVWAEVDGKQVAVCPCQGCINERAGRQWVDNGAQS